MSRFKPGDKVRLWKPGHVEHGDYGVVAEVIPIEKYHEGQPLHHRGPHAYRCVDGFKWCVSPHSNGATHGFLPEEMVVSEEDFQSQNPKAAEIL